MARRVLDRERAALARAEEGKGIEAGGVEHGLEIPHPDLEGDLAHIAVRQAGAARIIANERIAAGEMLEPRLPGEAAPLVLEVRQP
jgi:hypothetical protein